MDGELSSVGRDLSGKKVIVGLTGKEDSAVAAFLLKKQGLNVIGVAISVWDSERKATPRDFFKFCSAYDLDVIKNICDKIEIPFYVVNACDEYFDVVISPTLASSLEARALTPCFLCHKFKIKILYEKMKLLGADYLATGHYAKVYLDHSTGDYGLYSASDLKLDQSEFLADLSQDCLQKLILPLSDLTSSEVSRLSKTFKLPCIKERRKNISCYVHHQDYTKFLESNVHSDFRTGGQVVDIVTQKVYGEHDGIHKITIGDSEFINKSGSKGTSVQNLVVLKVDNSSKNVYLGPPEYGVSTSMQVVGINPFDSIDRTKMVMCYMKTSLSPKKYLVKVIFKSTSSAVVELTEPISFLQKGAKATFFAKDGSAAKILFSGTVDQSGQFMPLSRTGTDDDDRHNKKGKKSDDSSDKKNEDELKF